MYKFSFTIVLLLVAAARAGAADLGAPNLSAPMATSRIFDPERFLTTGGVKFEATRELTLEPELGVGYRSMERDQPGGVIDSHAVHAQAGGRLSLAQTLYLSAAAKLPVYTFESAGRYTGQDMATRQGYDFARPAKNIVNWTGEFGIHLSSKTDLTLYYDQSPVSGWMSGGPQQEELIGTRLIWRFK